jgi:DNA recombination protein RmuC
MISPMVITAIVVGVLAVLLTVGVGAAVLAAHLRRTAGPGQLQLRTEAFDQRVSGLHDEIRRMGELVATLRLERAEQQGQVLTSLREASRTTAALSDTTRQLREALASPKARGQWGERMADDVLRLAGLVEGVSYVRQTPLPGGTVPDVTFLLPGDLVLHMDVKFPVDNYLRSLEAASPAEQAAAEQAFLRDVRQRVKEIAGRGYVDPATTVDHVLVFIPNEAVYGFVHEHDPGLIDFALRQQVVLCSPCTLFAVLAVVRRAVEAFRLERTSSEVLRCVASFGEQWDRFSAQLDTVVKRVESVHTAIDDLAGPRRRQLQRTLDHLDGVRSQDGAVAPGGERTGVDPMQDSFPIDLALPTEPASPLNGSGPHGRLAADATAAAAPRRPTARDPADPVGPPRSIDPARLIEPADVAGTVEHGRACDTAAPPGRARPFDGAEAVGGGRSMDGRSAEPVGTLDVDRADPVERRQPYDGAGNAGWSRDRAR